MTSYISIKNQPFLFWYYSHASKGKGLKSRHFALISLKTDSPFNFTLKYMYNMPFIQIFFLEKCPLDGLRIFKCVICQQHAHWYRQGCRARWQKFRLLTLNFTTPISSHRLLKILKSDSDIELFHNIIPDIYYWMSYKQVYNK